MPLLGQYFLPSTRLVKESVKLLGEESRQLLTNLATEISMRLLNFRNSAQADLLQIDELVLIPDRLTRQKYSSLTNAIGRVIKIVNRTLYIQLLDHTVINRNNQHVISTEFQNSNNSFDLLELPLFGFVNCQPLQQFNSEFKYNLPKIADSNNRLVGHVDILVEDDSNDIEHLQPDKSDTTLVPMLQAGM